MRVAYTRCVLPERSNVVALHSSMIGGVQVAGFRYVVYGPGRGLVSTHRTKRAAFRSLAQDARARMAEGRPSDAQVYRWRDGWVVVGQEVDVELVELPQPPPTC